MLGFIPMPHKVFIEKASDQLDEWGLPVADSNLLPTEIAAQVSYNTKNEEIALASGEHIRFTAQILLEGVPSIDFNDFIVWTDATGKTYRKNPVEIMYKHDFSGSPIAVKVTV